MSNSNSGEGEEARLPPVIRCDVFTIKPDSLNEIGMKFAGFVQVQIYLHEQSLLLIAVGRMAQKGQAIAKQGL